MLIVYNYLMILQLTEQECYDTILIYIAVHSKKDDIDMRNRYHRLSRKEKES